MSETLSWLHEWNLIVSTNWMVFHDTHFSSWNISTLFFRNKNFKVVKEKFHHISPPLEISQNSDSGTCEFCEVSKGGLIRWIFLSQMVKFFFWQFAFNIQYLYTAAKYEWNFSIYNHEIISKEFLPDFWQNFFLLKYNSRIKDQISIENDVTD